MKTKFKNGVLFTLLATLLVGFNACSNDDAAESLTSASLSQKSTVIDQPESLLFLRDPSTAIGAFRMYGIKLTNDTYTSLTSSISTDDSSLGYDLYFYNEKVYANADTAGIGCPVLILGSGVSGYKTEYTGMDAFNNFAVEFIDESVDFQEDYAVTLPLPTGAPYRYSNAKLIRSYVKDTFYADASKFTIGNSFQGLDTTLQPIYVIYQGEHTYVVMISRFKNGNSATNVPATDQRYMTLIYRMLS